MDLRYREELARLGLPVPQMFRYTVHCQWRPPKDHWPLLGARRRSVSVTLNDIGDHQSAAIEACLFLIATHRGKCTAFLVEGHGENPVATDDVRFDWSWFDGVVTFGGEIVEVSWS